MTDKVQKIREEVERIQLYTQSEVLKQVLDYIDEVQKEPVSEVWHDAQTEQPQAKKKILATNEYGACEVDYAINMALYWPKVIKWAYIEDLLKLSNVQRIGKNCKEPVIETIDLEQELYKYFGQVKDFTLGMKIAQRFYEMGKQHQEPVSDDLESANLQKQKDDKDESDMLLIAYMDGVERGKAIMKQQMMKGAFIPGFKSIEFKLGEEYTFNSKNFDMEKAKAYGAKEGDTIIGYFIKKED